MTDTEPADSIRHPVDELPPPWQLIAGGLQHIAAMLAGVVAPPLIIGAAVGLDSGDQALLIAATLFSAGLGTLLQALGWWRFGSRLPLMTGASFAMVAPVLAIVKTAAPGQALPAVYGSILVVGVLGMFAAPYFSKLQRFFPPVVSGTVITLIGLSMLPVALGWVRGTGEGAADSASGVPMKNLAAAGLTLLVVLASHRFLRGFAQRLALLIGLVVGSLLAWPMGLIDTTPIRHASIIGFAPPMHFGAPVFQVGAIVSMVIVMLVVMTESTATMLALGEIVERPADERALANGLRAVGIASAVSALLGGFVNSAFAQNVGLVALCRMYSRYIVAVSGALLVLLGLFPIAAGVVELVPKPVLGGAGLVLFGTVAAGGIRTLAKAELGDPVNSLIVGVSLFIGMTPTVVPSFYATLPSVLQTIMGSGISAGCLCAIVLNQVFRLRRRSAEQVAAEMA